jgi:adenine phosphoribosyltransferase
MLPERDTYAVEIAGLKRRLPLFEVAPGLRIAVLNILGDTELVEACARALADKLQGLDYDVLVTAEAKSIPLAHALGRVTGKPYIILRKVYKIYMGEALQAQTVSITTGEPQTLFLDEKDRGLIEGKRVVLIDDVISTGSTLKGDADGRGRRCHVGGGLHRRRPRRLAGCPGPGASAAVQRRLNTGLGQR